MVFSKTSRHKACTEGNRLRTWLEGAWTCRRQCTFCRCDQLKLLVLATHATDDIDLLQCESDGIFVLSRAHHIGCKHLSRAGGCASGSVKCTWWTCKDRGDPEPCATAIVCCFGCDALAVVCYFLYRGPVFMYVCYAQS